MSTVSGTPSSSFTPPPSQTTPTDNTQTSTPAPTGIGGPSSSLYLYTFLVTLALLLSISASIIVRSYLIRRRIRRMIADGTWVPPEERGGRRMPLGEKPRLFEVWVGAEKGAPLAASYLNPKPAPTPESTESNTSPRRRFGFRFFRRSPPPSPPSLLPTTTATGPTATTAPGATTGTTSPDQSRKSAEKQPEAVGADQGENESAEVQLAMFIAMPFQHVHPHQHGQGSSEGLEGELPLLELGVRLARVPGSAV